MECWRDIAPGELYTVTTGKWDGDVRTERWCEHCAAAVAILDVRIKDFCFCYSEVWLDVDESHDYNGRDPVVMRLYVAAKRRKWRYKRGVRKGQLMPVPVLEMKVGV